MNYRLWVFATLIAAAAQAPAASPPRVALTEGAVFRDCANCPEMVVIPPGEFTMGADAGEAGRPEGAPHRVRIGYFFAAGRFEITNRQLTDFINATGHKMAEGCNEWDPAQQTIRRYPELGWRNPGYGRPPADDEPVVCLRWSDAKAYTAWLSAETSRRYRLLTEAEWEYLARAGTQSNYAWGENPADACRVANVNDAAHADKTYPAESAPCDDGYAMVAPIGRFPPNKFGLFDVIGNVWEWTEDCYRAPYPADAPRNGAALQIKSGCDRRAVRGGSWRSTMFRQRPSWRGRDPENQVSNIFGMRVARDLR
jgi:formylglycine-generating enzyme required for sulfatase activity